MLKVTLPGAYEHGQPIKDLVERLMGRDPAPRFEFIRDSYDEDETMAFVRAVRESGVEALRRKSPG
jgi:hypothetical protein